MSKKRRHDDSEHESDSKRRRYTGEDAALATIFDNLANEDDSIRLNAASELIKNHAVAKGSSRILDRLIRGLCSSRKAARLGFFPALTEYLKAHISYDSVSSDESLEERIDDFLQRINDNTQHESGASKQEKRDHALGRLTALSSLVDSGLLFSRNIDEEQWRRVFLTVNEISEQYPQLREQSGKLFHNITLLCIQKQKTVVISSLLDYLTKSKTIKTTQGLSVWIESQRSGLEPKYPPGVWHKNNPLSDKEIPTLKLLLLDRKDENPGDTEDGKVKSHGTRRDSPHYVWDVIFSYLMQNEKQSKGQKKKGLIGLEIFWNRIIDETYFADGASVERKALGFRIASNYLELSTGDSWSLVLSPKLLNCVFNQYENANRYLHKAAVSFLDTFCERARLDPKAGSVIFQVLIEKNGNERTVFERLRKTRKVMEKVITSLHGEPALQIIQHYQTLMLRPDLKEMEVVDSIRRIITELFLTIMSNHLDSSNELDSQFDTKTPILETIARCACLTSKWEDNSWGSSPGISWRLNPELSPTFRKFLHNRIWSFFKRNRTSALDRKALVAVAYFIAVPAYKDTRQLANLKNLDDDTGHDLGEASKILIDTVKIDRGGNKDVGAANEKLERHPHAAMKMLLATTLIQAYCGEEDAITTSQELRRACTDILNRDDETRTSDVVLEIIVQLCGRQENIHRTLAQDIFKSFTSQISADGLQSLIRILSQKESMGGQKELFDKISDAESANSSDTEADEEDEVDDDVDIVDIDSSGESNTSDENDTDVEVDDADEKDKALNNALGEILQTRTDVPLKNDNIEDDQSSSEESMDDDQMEALQIDSKLSNIFRQRGLKVSAGKDDSKSSRTKNGAQNSQKKEQKGAKQNMINFKVKVLDLIEVYVNYEYSNSLCLDLMLPLLRLVGDSRSPQISKRSSDVLNLLFQNAKKNNRFPVPKLDNPDLWRQGLVQNFEDVGRLMREVHDDALRFPQTSKLHTSTASRCSLFLARCLYQSYPNNPDVGQVDPGQLDDKRENQTQIKPLEQLRNSLQGIYDETHRKRLFSLDEGGKSKLPVTFWTDYYSWTFDMPWS